MRNNYRPSYNIRYSEGFEYFVFGNAQFVAFSEVLFDTVIATKNHGCNQSEQFFSLDWQSAFLIRIRIKVEQALEDEIILRKDFLVHSGAIVVEVGYLAHSRGI